MQSQPGFTIIELLAVIAIIGILAAVILGSLGDARESGLEAKVKAEMAVLAKRARVDESQALTFDVICGSNGFATSTEITRIITSIERFSPEAVVCNSDTAAFAVSAALSSSTYWCVDSEGKSVPAGAQLSSGVLACP